MRRDRRQSRRLVYRGGTESHNLAAATFTEIMQLFHALLPVIGCTFAAEVHRHYYGDWRYAFARETMLRCSGQFLRGHVNDCSS